MHLGQYSNSLAPHQNFKIHSSVFLLRSRSWYSFQALEKSEFDAASSKVDMG
jgi:hypothetical protein